MCPSKSATCLGVNSFTVPSSARTPVTSFVAKVCHYGIITTNGKSLDFQGVSAFVAVYSIPFPKLKYGEKIDEKRRLLH